MYVYGGFDAEGFVCNDLFSLNEEYCWEKETTSVKLPSRLHASACVINDTMYISGGLDHKKKPTSDMFAIHFPSMQVTYSEGYFEPRYAHSMVVSPKNTLLIVGGMLNETSTYAQVLEYNLEKQLWKWLESPDDFHWNAYQRACVLNNTLYSFGGTPNMKLINGPKLNKIELLSDDIIVYILGFLPLNALNNLIATSKSLKICQYAAGMLQVIAF